MRGLAAYCLTGFVAVLATCAIEAIMPAPSLSAGSVARDSADVQRVNRGGKEDRLDINTSVIRKRRPPPPQSQRKIMSGCEPVFSPLGGRPDNFAGHCTA